MRRSFVALVLLAGLLVACGDQQATSAQSGAPAATGGLSTPVAGATPVAGTTQAPTTAPTPTVKQLAAAYLKAATASNKALDKAWATFEKSKQTLTDAKRLVKAYAAADLAFIRAVQKINFYGDLKPIARRLLTYTNQAWVAARSGMYAKSWAEWNSYWDDRGAVALKVSAAANELRVALGLPPVPIK